jgi:hypothetical protein
MPQVACHTTPHDCWVSFLGSVYNITRLIKVRGAHPHQQPSGATASASEPDG